MNVTMFGIGRSGTTVLYRLLQGIMSDALSSKVEYVYEPFLWNRDIFNTQYSDMSAKFESMNSVSIEGMYSNKQLPLFITETQSKNLSNNEYVQGLYSPQKPDNSILLKFIRANGRYRLLKNINPEGKFIFVIRNPIDVINSVINMFSFYGDDFHPTDFPRFVDEVNQLYGANLQKNTHVQAEREVLYWYYMNLFALESFLDSNNPPLVICYESFATDNQKYIKKTCDYLNVEYKSEYQDIIKKTVGYSSKKTKITEKEYEILSNYLNLYSDLLDKFNIENNFDQKTIHTKYRDKKLKSRPNDGCQGKTPPAIKSHLFQKFNATQQKHCTFKHALKKIKNKVFSL